MFIVVACSIAEASLGVGRAKHNVVAAHEWNSCKDFHINIWNNQGFKIEPLVVTSQLEFGFTFDFQRFYISFDINLFALGDLCTNSLSSQFFYHVPFSTEIEAELNSVVVVMHINEL